MTRADIPRRLRALQFWRKDQRANYRDVFGAPEVEPTRAQAAVLKHLREFCFANRGVAQSIPIFSFFGGRRAGVVDSYAMALAEGRREVWLLIDGFLNLTDEQLSRIELMELQQRQNTEKHSEEDS
jgi:hypothetical protein